MARLPGEQDLGALSVGGSGRPIATIDASGYARGAAAVADGVQQLGQGISKAGQAAGDLAQWQTRQAQLDEARAQSKFLLQSKEARAALASAADPAAIEQASARFKQAPAEAAALIPDPERQALFRRQRDLDTVGDLMAVNDKRFALRSAQEVLDVHNDLDTLRQAALDSTDDAERLKLIAAGGQLIAGLHRAGRIDDERAAQWEQSWVQDYAAESMNRTPPEQAVAALRAPPGGGLADFIPQDKRAALLQRAEAALLERQRQAESERSLATFNLQSRITDDMVSVATTGVGFDDLSFERVQSVLGPQVALQWQAGRDDARAVWSASHDLSTLTEPQIEQRLAALRPAPGGGGEESESADPNPDAAFGDGASAAPDAARRQAVYDHVLQRADELRIQRAVDPASSVADDPLVAKATALAADNDPASFKALVQARLAAQQRAGIPFQEQSPITRQEATQLAGPLFEMTPGREGEVVSAMMADLKQRYGASAEQAFAYVLRAQDIEIQTSFIAAQMAQRLALGRGVTREAWQAFDDATSGAPPSPWDGLDTDGAA